jgi:sulfatase modifying factor 1
VGKGGGNTFDESAKKSWGVALAHYTVFSNYDDGHAFTAPVGSYSPNSFGVYDMTGNVHEWCADHYEAYAPSEEILVNPRPEPGASGTITVNRRIQINRKVLRGGAWNLSTSDPRVSDRGHYRYRDASDFVGFRVARDAVVD